MATNSGNEKNVVDQRGRPSNLARYRKLWHVKEEIAPLEFAKLDDPDWVKFYGSYIYEAFVLGKISGKFRMTDAMKEFIEQRLKELNNGPMARWFELSARSGLDKLPPLKMSNRTWYRAAKLGRHLMTLAQWNPDLVRAVVLGYCYAVSSRRLLVLTDKEDAAFGQQLISLVNQLKMREVSYRLVGFRIGCNLPDISWALDALNLPDNTPTAFEAANNVDSPARLKHAGIRISWAGASCPSREWHVVMVLAAVIELWRCTTRSDIFQLAS